MLWGQREIKDSSYTDTAIKVNFVRQNMTETKERGPMRSQLLDFVQFFIITILLQSFYVFFFFISSFFYIFL